MNNIIEATAREVMTKREKILKKKLIALLKDDGKGHKHAKYAERLEDFIVKIVDSKKDPNMTAAVSFDEVTIYVSDGFLKDPDTFYQLNVLMRHELAHYLMQHQIRMMHKIISKYGKDGETRIRMSQSLHRLINIIEDFEISNTRYTSEDKIVVKNMLLNGRLIGGLVTEEIRQNWKSLDVLKMYDSLSDEIENLQKSILARWEASSSLDIEELNNVGLPDDFIHHNIKQTMFYADTNARTNFLGSIEKFLKNQALYHFFIFDEVDGLGRVRPCIVKYSSLPEVYQNIIKTIGTAIPEGYKNSATGETLLYTKQILRDYIASISKSNPLETLKLNQPQSNTEIVTLYTPEEKLLASDTLKALLPTLELKQTWYDKVTKVFGDPKYSLADLETALAAVEK